MIVPFIDVLKRLAETSENQKKYLTELGTFPSTDELALEFDDYYHVVMANLNESQYLSLSNDTVVENLRGLNALFDKMSSIKDSRAAQSLLTLSGSCRMNRIYGNKDCNE